MKILVTGSAGFIGFHLTNKLIRLGHDVVGIDNLNDYYSVDLKIARLREAGILGDYEQFGTKIRSSKYKGYTFMRMDLEESDKLIMLFEQEKFDIVVNLAAQAGVRYSIENPQAYIRSNINGFFNILESCRKFPVKRLIYASSSSVYGNNTKMPLSTDDRVDQPISLYAATKKSNELMAFTYSHLFGIKTVGLRFFTVYGPWGRPDMAYFSFTKAILEGRPIKVFNNGELYRDFTYIDDIVEGITKIAFNNNSESTVQSKSRSTIYNIGNSSPVRLSFFIETIEKALQKKAIKEYCGMQPGDVYKTYADTSPLEQDFGWKPSTSIEYGIEEFVKWYQSYFQH